MFSYNIQFMNNIKKTLRIKTSCAKCPDHIEQEALTKKSREDL